MREFFSVACRDPRCTAREKKNAADFYYRRAILEEG
jgi:hypothetical protein